MQNNLLFELIPLIIFFVVYYLTKNIFTATGVLIATSWLQLIICKIKYKFISKKLWISTILVTIFGGITILLHNEFFIMLKPSILYWILGIGMIIGQILGKNGLQILAGKEINLPITIWNRLNLAGAIYFIFLGFLNLFIALNFSESTWVNFKVFGATALTFLFIIICIIAVAIYKKKQNKTNINKY